MTQPRRLVRLGQHLVVDCAVALSREAQARGLQGREPLQPGEGMLFPYDPPRPVSFHMGTVSFPIDLVFVADGQVARIVHAAQPGTASTWSHERCAAVVEVAGGLCRKASVEPGSRVAYNPIRPLVEATSPPLSAGYYSHEPLGTHPPPVPYSDTRFEDRKLVDEADPNAADQPSDHWLSRGGYQPGAWEDAGVGPNVRHSGFRLEDPGLFAARAADAVAQHAAEIPWKADILTVGATDHAVLSVARLAAWLGLRQKTALRATLQQPELLDLVGQGLVLAGIADSVRASTDGTKLVLYRGHRDTRI